MLRKTMILLPAALLGALPFAASAETMDQSELDMFRSASLTIQQASDAALQAHAGTLAAVAFGDENGRAAYEAVVIGGDGQPWTVLIDANTGNVFASALSSSMDDHDDEGDGPDDEDQDGETNDG
ncbi:PepSY domain-containing protein [Mesobacterium sp. TK19101]|uniref:PepSY domain-containing protein n=1 Tax=Mesobacterium hydrothermale TaxID=3111907 RepID=A0ABU6HHZ2_9RHOB|nr:PepSY domain-containing protein [Mesobacterium sp. TK19101]MEC3862080.1 PepSY domain-containing protein [Mesobacterium sp. TK19101]